MYIHKNQGTLFKERNGVWYVNTIIDGKRIRKSLQTKDKRVAQKNFFEFLQRPIEKKTRFSDVLTFLLQEKSHRLKSFDVFRYHAKVVNDALGDQLVHTVSEMVIREFVNVRLKLKRRPATINRELSIIKQTLELAVLQGYIPSIPRIPRLSETGNARQGFFTDEEMRRLLPYLPEYLRDFTLFAYLMGWRKSEIASLTWSDFDGVCLRLRDSKTGEQRVLPLNAGLSALIERRWQARCGTFIFHRDGHPIRHLRRAWNTACQKAGLPGRLFHDTRRSAVRRLIQHIPERQVMLITGHKTRSILERYHILTERDLLEVWRNFGGDDATFLEPAETSTPPSLQPTERVGGSVWESNPPSRGLAPITGFEVQAAHQHRYASTVIFQWLAK